MGLIYEPNGRAREYSPLALNIYHNCDHNCSYCYNRKGSQALVAPEDVQAKDCFRARLVDELRKTKITRQVLLSFLGDPYCIAEMAHQHTRFALDQLSRHHVPVAILTKGGQRALRDLNRFTTMDCKVGATLTFENQDDSLSWEPNAAVPSERIAMLERMKRAGVRTWVSLEPVIDPEQTLALIDLTHEFVDEYRVGRLNHIREPHPIDWRRFAGEAIEKLRGYGKAFYIKQDLQCFAYGLTDAETDPDCYCLTTEGMIHA